MTHEATSPHLKSILSAGAWAGLIAGIGMAALAMILSGATGEGVMLPIDLTGATFLGVQAILGGVVPFVVGLGTHLVLSVLLGMVFSYLIRKENSALAAFWSGIIYSVVVWLVMAKIVVPAFNVTLNERIPTTGGAFFVQHLVYGALLFVTPLFRMEYEQRQRRQEEPHLRKVG